MEIFRNGARVKTVFATTEGYYRTRLPSRRGRYFALTPLREPFENVLCLKARSDRASTPVSDPDPTDPTDPSDPTDPTDSTDPVDPTEPVGPGEDPVKTCWDYTPEETEFAQKMNEARAAAGVAPLRLDPELSRAAREHTDEMYPTGTLYHSTSEELRTRVKNWQRLGENVGLGATVTTLHAAFMNSPAHKANIVLGGYNHVGIAAHQTSERLWVTVIFQGVEDPETSLPMPSC